MTGAALTKFGLAPSTCVIVAPICLRSLPRSLLPLIAANICPRDCNADSASGRARRIRDAAARDRRPGARGDARLAGAAAAAARPGRARGPLRQGRLAAFSLAVDQPTVARSALARLSEHNGARPRLAARLAYREGRLADAVTELDGAGGWRAARLRRSLLAELSMLEPGRLTLGGPSRLAPAAAPAPVPGPGPRG